MGALPEYPFHCMSYIKSLAGLPAKQEGDLGVSIGVKDNGNGIPTPVKEKIFQPFFTTKPTGEGTWLGLCLSYNIIIANGGVPMAIGMKVETKENEGSIFIIQLPTI